CLARAAAAQSITYMSAAGASEIGIVTQNATINVTPYAVGDLQVLLACPSSTTTTPPTLGTVTDSASSPCTWHLGPHRTVIGAAHSSDLELWYCLSAPQTTPTYGITAHLSAAPSNQVNYRVMDFNASASPWTFDQPQTNAGTTSAGPADTGITSAIAGPPEVAIAGFCNDDTTNSFGFGIGGTADAGTIGSWPTGNFFDFGYAGYGNHDSIAGYATLLSSGGTVGVKDPTGGTIDWAAVIGTFLAGSVIPTATATA